MMEDRRDRWLEPIFWMMILPFVLVVWAVLTIFGLPDDEVDL